MDYAAARYNMVESQIRTNKVTDPRLIDAMAHLPRELFVPKSMRGVAYVDEDIAISAGCYLTEPMVLARLLQTAGVDASDVVLVIGCGTGYATAVLSRLAGTVVGLESDPDMAKAAGARLEGLDIDNAVVVEGALTDGYSKQAPYNVILIDGRVERIPESILDQLADGGRLVTVYGGIGLAQAIVIEKRSGHVMRREIFDAATPALPGFERSERFVF